MKTVWARISMELQVSDEEAAQLKEEIGDTECFEINDEFAKRFIKDGKLSNDSYIPNAECIS